MSAMDLVLLSMLLLLLLLLCRLSYWPCSAVRVGTLPEHLLIIPGGRSSARWTSWTSVRAHDHVHARSRFFLCHIFWNTHCRSFGDKEGSTASLLSCIMRTSFSVFFISLLIVFQGASAELKISKMDFHSQPQASERTQEPNQTFSLAFEWPLSIMRIVVIRTALAHWPRLRLTSTIIGQSD